MTGKEIVKKLREAGINASLTHRIHDEFHISIETPFEELEARLMASLMKGSGVGMNLTEPKLLPAPKEFMGMQVGEYYDTKETWDYIKMDAENTLALRDNLPFENCVFVDYIKNVGSKADGHKWDSLAKELREIANRVKSEGLPPQVVATQKPKDINDGSLQYMETLSRLRHYTRSKCNMDSND
jgi:hypothetical protein